MSLPPGTRIGPYEISAPLGAGGMGEVYRARDARLHRDVAIKILPEVFAADPDRAARFAREAQSLAALNHPHIAQVYGVEDAGPTRAIVMEMVEGDTLADRMGRGPLPIEDALPIARQITDALAAAHDAGIVHRDLKPANIKVRDDGTVKVLDFGLAKAMETARHPGARTPADGRPTPAALMNSTTMTSPAATMHGVILGTAAYMAPEQARGKSVDQRADIWAFGCVLYEMLTGRPAFSGDDVTELVTAVLRDEPDWSALPATATEPLRRLLRRMLAKDPRRRLQSARDVQLDLEDAMAAPSETVAVPRGPTSLWQLVVAAATGAALVAAAVFLAAPWFSPPAGESAPGRLSLSFWLPDPGGIVNELAISPDGRYLVTGGVGASGIHVHPLDGGAARHVEALPAGVCWSPDSRTLLYPRPDGRMVKLDVASGSSVLFAEPPSGGRGHCTWGAAGVILASGTAGVFRIPASGGEWTPLEIDDGGGREGPRRAPVFLPDGRHFLYAIPGPTRRSVSIRVASIDAPETSVLLDDAESDVAYAEGHLLFQRGPDLVAQPFDPQTLTLSGEPRAVAAGTHSGVLGPGASFTVSATGILVHAAPKLGRAGRLEWFDRSGRSHGIVPAPAGTEFLNPSLSPDQRTLAVNAMDEATGNWDTWLVDMSSGRATRLTTQPGPDSDPVWAPDSQQIVYRSERPDHVGLYRISLADRREEPLLRCAILCGRIIPSEWTPDGRFVLYDSGATIGHAVLVRSDTEAKPPQIPGAPAVVSPDGRWIAYMSSQSGSAQVYVRSYPGPGPPTTVSTVSGSFPSWRADGKELFFSGRAAGVPFTVLAVDVTVDGNGIRTSDPRPAVPNVDLVTAVDSRPHFEVSADGQRILMRRLDGPPQPPLRVIVNWHASLR